MLSDPVAAALAQAHERYTTRRPRTRAMQAEAGAVLPGGNTRTVLYHRPFPLRVVRASAAMLEDADGHRYVDLLGNFSAGLFGHSHPALRSAVVAAAELGASVGAHTPHEVALARAVCERFPAVESVRFTNSGTEANLMALAAARAVTGRDRVLAFHGGYHGGVLNFTAGPSVVNAPYDVVLAPYNDTAAAVRLLADNADTMACVLVEPMLGAGGCIPGEPGFLQALRDVTSETGALLVFDEVMTSRIGPCGLGHRLGIPADLTTLGKYLGGGASIGAFGGRADVMDVFDPAGPQALSHAGTFNNNLISMMAGLAGLTEAYPPAVAERHTARGDHLRADLAALFARTGAPFQVTGLGSLLTVHATRQPVRSAADAARGDARLRELLFLDLLERGYYIAPRGFLALSLAVTDEQLQGFLAAVEDVVASRVDLVAGGGPERQLRSASGEEQDQ